MYHSNESGAKSAQAGFSASAPFGFEGAQFGGYPAQFGGFPAQFGGYAPGAEFAAPTVIGGAYPTAVAGPTYIAAPVFRKPGYNERYVAWKNRQTAFNKYKKLMQKSITDTRHATYYPAPVAYAPTVIDQGHFAGAYPTAVAPQFGGYPTAFPGAFPQQFGYPGMPVDYGTMAYPQQASQYEDRSQAQEEAQAPVDEPEIRGTQV
mmetsp:Transcript_14005/g.32607  ORF Transcript_14005/g.32607 Transcript_14005/m.32607 type:complete len:205 (-) Transcript_14005:138-752(-)